jgi:hypothetical protein
LKIAPSSLTQIKVILSWRAEDLAGPVRKVGRLGLTSRMVLQNAQLFRASHRYSDDHACNFVGAI